MFPNTEKGVCTKLLLMVLLIIMKMETCPIVQVSTLKWNRIIKNVNKGYIIAQKILG